MPSPEAMRAAEAVRDQYQMQDATRIDKIAALIDAEFATLQESREMLAKLLWMIRDWDVIDVTADGEFWKRRIDAALQSAKGDTP